MKKIFFALLFYYCTAAWAMHWVEIPSPHYVGKMPLSKNVLEKIVPLVEVYHQLDPGSPEMLGKRIDSLEKILACIDGEVNNHSQTLNLLVQHIQDKKEYLEAIQMLALIDLDLHAREYHLSNDPSFLTMRNERLFSLRMKEYWGDFWWESIDPCHRRLSPYVQKWEENFSPKFTADFFLWLETQCVPRQIPIVKYFSEDELLKFEYFVMNGLLVRKQDLSPLNTQKGSRNIVTVTSDGRIYIGESSSEIWHSSFSHGKPIFAAAVVQARQGVLQVLSIESGHYFPTIENGYDFLNYLVNQGIDLPDELTVQYYHDTKKYSVILNNVDLSKEETFIETLLDDAKRNLISTAEF